jgi:hypothetical protein
MAANKQLSFEVLAVDPTSTNGYFLMNLVFNAMSGAYDVYIQDTATSDHQSLAANVPATGTPISGSGGSGITIGQVVNGATPDSVLFVDAAGDLADDPGITYDSVNQVFFTGDPAQLLANLIVDPLSDGISALCGAAQDSGFIATSTDAYIIADNGEAGLGIPGNSPHSVYVDVSSGITFDSSLPINFTADVRQTFAPGATVPGLNVGAVAGDPSTPVDGDLWYDGTGELLRARINGATVTLGAVSTPGGSTTQVQYNNAGAFGGISGLTTDGTNVTAGSGNLRATSPRITTGLLDANGNEIISFTAVGSAINEITVSNNSVGNSPIISATGGDTNINIILTPKGSGQILHNGGLVFNQNNVGNNPLAYQLGTSAGAAGFGQIGGSDIVIYSSSLPQIRILNNDIRLAVAAVFGFASGSPTATAIDTGFARNAAGVWESNNGTLGTFRDMICRNHYLNSTTVRLTSGSGTPEGAVTAPVGSLYTDTAGGALTTLWVKETGAGNTGWVAK